MKLLIMSALLLGLPLGGILSAGYPVQRYLEFPPETRFIDHAPFSRIAFIMVALMILVCVIPFIASAAGKSLKEQKPAQKYFPWWGWLGVVSLVFSWIPAWTRHSFFECFQQYTFVPLWLSYIVVVNALTFRRKGSCMLVDRTAYFAALFFFSAVFWWFFEYLNRFVQNWYYVGAAYGALKYFLLATLSFSTVLPAVLGTRELLLSSTRLNEIFQSFFQWKPANPRRIALFSLSLSALGLACIGIFPNYLFPLLWISPLLIIISLQALFKESHILSGISHGDWSVIVTSAAAALICGIFWEMWNYYSLVKWEYSVPLVHAFEVFEMPVLGYAGYLPFGLQCVVVGEMIEKLFTGSKGLAEI